MLCPVFHNGLPNHFPWYEEWRIITLFVNHLDSRLKYTDLLLQVVDRLVTLQTLSRARKVMLWLGNETLQFSRSQSWWNSLWTSPSFWPVVFRGQSAPYWGSSVHTSSLATPLATTYHYSFVRAPFGACPLVAALYWALVCVPRHDSRPGPGGSRTAASCQPQAWRPSAIPLHHSAGCYNISSFNLLSWSSQCSSSLTLRNIGLRTMGRCACIHLIDGNQRTQ